MKFKTAVFTAEHGYRWTTPPEGVSESQLTQYGQIIDRASREGMGTADYVQGVIDDGSRAVVFSVLRTPPGWDTAGRAAKYYAVAFVPRESCPDVDFDALLADRFFRQPEKCPPSEVEYAGPGSAHVGAAVLASFVNGGRGPESLDFACLGDFLSIPSNRGKRWRFYRTNIPNWRDRKIEFDRGNLFDDFMARSGSSGVPAAAKPATLSRPPAPPRYVEPIRPSASPASAESSELPSAEFVKLATAIRQLRQEAAESRRQVAELTRGVCGLSFLLALLCAAVAVWRTGVLELVFAGLK